MNDDLENLLTEELPARAFDEGAPLEMLRRAIRLVCGNGSEPATDDPAMALATLHRAKDAPNPGAAVRKALAGALPDLPGRNDWSKPLPAHRWLVEGWLSRGRVALLSGRGGAGKSKLGIMLAYAIAAGDLHWFDGGPEVVGGRGPVVFASWEDDPDEMQRRLLNNPAWRLDGATDLAARIADRFDMRDLAGMGPLWRAGEAGRSHADPTGELSPPGAALRARCETLGARLLVIDPLAAAFALNENNRGAVRGFVSDWDRWGRDTGCTVLLIAHPPKGGDGEDARYAGSTDWRNAVRSFLYLERENGVSDRAKLHADKVSYSKAPDPVELARWTWWEASESVAKGNPYA